MGDTEKNPKTMMFLNMDFRMTTLIPFLVFCLCMSSIFKTFFLQNCANVILQVQTCPKSYHGSFFSQLIKETTISCLYLYMNLA